MYQQYLFNHPEVKEEAFYIFIEAINALPPTGVGKGNHNQQMRCAHLGKKAKLPEDDCIDFIEKGIDDSERPLASDEVGYTVRKAYSTTRKRITKRVPRPAASGERLRRIFQMRADRELKGEDPEKRLRAMSPGPNSSLLTQAMFLSSIYAPDEHIFMGQLYHSPRGIPTVADYLKRGQPSGPYIIPNPFTNEPRETYNSKTKKSKSSWRCDACVKDYPFLLCEMDDKSLTRTMQLKIWLGVILSGIPIASLTWSGGKSLHVLVYTGAKTYEEWLAKQTEWFYPIFVPLGVDPACSNPSRLSRSPAYIAPGCPSQPLLYLNPEVRT